MPRKADTLCAGGCGKLLWRAKASALAPTCRSCRALDRLKAGLQPWGRPDRECVCEECGYRFRPLPAAVGRFCSAECTQTWQRAHLADWAECAACGRPFKRNRSRVKYCDQACYSVGGRGPAPGNGKGRRPAHDRGLPQHLAFVGLAACAECGELMLPSRTGRRLYHRACAERRNCREIAAKIMERYNSDPQYRAAMIARSRAKLARHNGMASRDELMDYLAAKAGGMCQLCGGRSFDTDPHSPWYATADHIFPRSLGGSDDASNLQLAHARCNASKGNRTAA